MHLSYSAFAVFSSIFQTWSMENLTSLDLYEIIHIATDHAQSDSGTLFTALVCYYNLRYLVPGVGHIDI